MIKPINLFKTIETHHSGIKGLGVKRIGIFGSYARRQEKKYSDVDVLVDFYPGKKTFNNYVELKELLTKIFGHPVDLVTRQAIKPLIKNTILKEVRYAKL